MESGAEGELTTGTTEGGEEPISEGADSQGSQGTDGSADEKWQDLDPKEFPQIPPEVVTSLNKRAVTQYQNKVRQVVESNKPYRQKVSELEGLKQRFEGHLNRWMENPETFLEFHKKQNPNYWQQRQQASQPAEDKAAVEALRRAGFIAKDDLKPVVEMLQEMRGQQEARETSQARTEIDSHVKWCGDNKYPWNDKIGAACVALIANGHVPSGKLQDAYKLLYQHSIDETTQAQLKRKKLGNTATPTGTGNAKTTGMTLRQIIERADSEG